MSGAGDPVVMRIRDALEDKGWSQRQLADKAVLGESTVFRLLRGEYTTKTVRKVERVLGIGAGAESPPDISVADLRYGGYVRQLFAYYETSYVCLRTGFTDPNRLAIYGIDISWSDEERALVFSDRNPGYQQHGIVCVPVGAPFLYLVTLDQGSARQITLYQAPAGESVLKGMVVTLSNPRGRELYPAVAPLLLIRRDAVRPDLAALSGIVARDHPAVAPYARILDGLSFQAAVLRP